MIQHVDNCIYKCSMTFRPTVYFKHIFTTKKSTNKLIQKADSYYIDKIQLFTNCMPVEFSRNQNKNETLQKTEKALIGLLELVQLASPPSLMTFMNALYSWRWIGDMRTRITYSCF